MKNLLVFCMLGLICMLGIFQFVSATQPTQQYNKIYLNPFYRSSMTSETNYTYNVTINPPDKISSIVSSIVSFDVYITPTVTFTLWINNQSCNNPTFLVHTTYAGVGQARINFDCSNVITKSGTYVIILKPTQANTGAVNGWLDLTYMNNPIGELTLSGTEYQVGDAGTTFVQLLDNNKKAVNSGSCYISSYYPNKTIGWNSNLMTYLTSSDGLYYKDFTAPSIVGIYMLSSTCYTPTTSFTDAFDDFTKIKTYQNVTIPSGAHYLTLAIPTNSTGYKNPTSCNGDWNTCGQAIGSDDTRSTTSVNGEQTNWYGFPFNIPSGSVINGITISIEASSSITDTTGANVELSWNNGSSYTSTGYGYSTSSSTDAIFLLGNSTNTWGRTWNVTDFNSSNFKIRLTKTGTGGINDRVDNILINVNYTSQYPLSRGYAQSIDINMTGYQWKNFSATYSLNNGNISFEVRNQNNVTLCTGLGDISVCANSTSPIKLYALLTTNGTSSSPTLDDWTLTWLTNETIQEIKGAGELHISNPFNISASINFSAIINNTAIAEAVWNYNNTINSNILSQFANSVWTLFSSTYNFINSIVESTWTRIDRNLTYYPTTPASNLTAQEVWEYSNRTLTYYDVTVINETSIALNVWNSTTRELTHYVINNISASDIWTYGTRDLTYYPTPSFNFTINGTDIASQVWGYGGTINGNILTQFSNKVQCVIKNLLAELNGDEWGVDITIC